jgi:hypothetical protein
MRSLFVRGPALLALLSTVLTLAFSVSLTEAAPSTRIIVAEQSAIQEYELKAVYLYNFLQFVQWPEDKRSLSKDGSMIIGIIGESPFGESLNDLRREIRQRNMPPIKIVYYGTYEDVVRESRDISNCHLLFLCPSERDRFNRIIADLNNAPVLTVADTEHFLSAGGMITLVQSNGKMRWIVNRTAVDKSGLRFSAQLLSIALKVVGDN